MSTRPPYRPGCHRAFQTTPDYTKGDAPSAAACIEEHGIHDASDPCPKHAPVSYSMHFAKHKDTGLIPASIAARIHQNERWRLM